MKQLLLILAFLLPLCAYPQLKEPFNGPEITSDNPWTGDLDCFVIENGWLVSRADPTRKSVREEFLWKHFSYPEKCFHRNSSRLFRYNGMGI